MRLLIVGTLSGQVSTAAKIAIARGAITGQRHDGRWTDVGTPERLAALDAQRPPF